MKKNIEMIPLLLGFMLFFVQGDSSAAAPLLVALAADFNISPSMAGLSIALYMIPFGLFTLLFGPLGDKYGRTGLIKIASFGTALFSILGGLSNQYWILLTFRVFNGIFASALMPVSMALVGELAGTDSKNLHKMLSKTMSLMFFGGAIAPLAGGTLSYFGSWRIVYIFYGVCEFILAFLILRKISYKSEKQNSLTLVKAYGDAFKNGPLIRTVSLMALLGCTVLAGFAYLGKYTEIRFSLSLFQIGLFLSLYGLGTITGGRIGPRMQSRFPGMYFLISGGLGISAMLLIALSSMLWLTGIGLFFLGLSFTFIQPRLIAQAQSLNNKGRGTVMSLASLNMSLGAGLGTLLYGFILREYGFQSIYFMGALLFLIITLGVYGITLRGKKKEGAAA